LEIVKQFTEDEDYDMIKI